MLLFYLRRKLIDNFRGLFVDPLRLLLFRSFAFVTSINVIIRPKLLQALVEDFFVGSNQNKYILYMFIICLVYIFDEHCVFWYVPLISYL